MAASTQARSCARCQPRSWTSTAGPCRYGLSVRASSGGTETRLGSAVTAPWRGRTPMADRGGRAIGPHSSGGEVLDRYCVLALGVFGSIAPTDADREAMAAHLGAEAVRWINDRFALGLPVAFEATPPAREAEAIREAARKLLGAHMADEDLVPYLNALEDACGFGQQGDDRRPAREAEKPCESD